MSEQIITKICSRCKPKQIKPLSEFYKDARHKDGHCSECKICSYEAKKRYKQSEKYRAYQKSYQKRYRQSGKRKIVDKRYNQSEKGKRFRRKYALAYFKNHPEQHKARQTIRNAIKNGKLPHPDTLKCHYCPAQAEQYHHHKGYAPEHWLDVVPACSKCHLLFR